MRGVLKRMGQPWSSTPNMGGICHFVGLNAIVMNLFGVYPLDPSSKIRVILLQISILKIIPRTHGLSQ
jgi:hypothetical protein